MHLTPHPRRPHAAADGAALVTPWGQFRQPASVQGWRYPVLIKDLDTGASLPVRIDAALLGTHRFFLEYGYPVPFSASIGGKVSSCVEVTGTTGTTHGLLALTIFPLAMASRQGASHSTCCIGT